MTYDPAPSEPATPFQQWAEIADYWLPFWTRGFTEAQQFWLAAFTPAHQAHHGEHCQLELPEPLESASEPELFA